MGSSPEKGEKSRGSLDRWTNTVGLGQGHPGWEDQSLGRANCRRAGSWECWLSALLGPELQVMGGGPNWGERKVPQDFPGNSWGGEAEHGPSRSGVAKIKETAANGRTDSEPPRQRNSETDRQNPLQGLQRGGTTEKQQPTETHTHTHRGKLRRNRQAGGGTLGAASSPITTHFPVTHWWPPG